MEKATFGSGCFWCTEAVFQRIIGVEKVVSGYAGGRIKNPTYREICSGLTGHAEVIQLVYDENIVSYEELLEIFWKTHDPTTLNKQGHDVGTHYRSVVFYHNDKQKNLAEAYKQELETAGIWSDPIVTEISRYEEFYVADLDHQDYYNRNKSQPYCGFVIKPKIDKVEQIFKDKLKTKLAG